MSNELKVGELVWAKMKGYSLWPGKISELDPGMKAKDKRHYVFFFGSENYAWVANENVFPHSDQFLEQQKAKKTQSNSFKAAIAQIELESSGKEKQSNTKDKQASPETTPVTTPNKSETLSPKLSALTLSQKLFEDSLNKSPKSGKKAKPEEVSKTKPIKKRPLPYNEHFNGSGSSKKGKADTADVASKVAIVPPLDHIPIGVETTTKKIGFIGLGMMGESIVTWLLNSGHSLTVYNRTSKKCQPFVERGAAVAKTPACVVTACDIIFICVTGPPAVKDIVFGNNGILQGLDRSTDPSKGIVELSSIDPTTAEEVGEAIVCRGGRYLLSVLSGSRFLVEKASMIVLSSGSRELFGECESCFHSFSRKAYFLAHSFDTGARMNLIVNMLTGSTNAALAEAVSLVSSCNLSVKDFLQILKLSPLSCPLLVNKASAMVTEDFASDISLKHQQKDLRMALAMGTLVSQPMSVSAATHEVYKRAKKSHSEKDISAVIDTLK